MESGALRGCAPGSRGCAQATRGCAKGVHRRSGDARRSPGDAHREQDPLPRAGLQAEPPGVPLDAEPRSPRGAPSRPAPGQAGGAVPGGGRWPGPPLPRRTSGNVVRAAPLRKFFTLHVSLTAGLGFLGKGGQAGGRPRPTARGGPQLLGETRGPRGGCTLRPASGPSSSVSGAAGRRPCPGRRGDPGRDVGQGGSADTAEGTHTPPATTPTELST